jgi:hypothetical protein
MNWPTYENTNELIRPGHWVKVFIQRHGGVMHHGIVTTVTPTDEGFRIKVIHNKKDGGVTESTWDDFRSGGMVLGHRQPISDIHAGSILTTAFHNIGKPYSAFSQNCEHFCSFCYEWKAKSDTLEAAKWIALALGLVIGGAFIFPGPTDKR